MVIERESEREKEMATRRKTKFRSFVWFCSAMACFAFFCSFVSWSFLFLRGSKKKRQKQAQTAAALASARRTGGVGFSALLPLAAFALLKSFIDRFPSFVHPRWAAFRSSMAPFPSFPPFFASGYSRCSTQNIYLRFKGRETPRKG
jgi:hypothetical protein